MVFGAFDARVDDGRLSATARGEPLEGSGLTPAVEIKGATFTELLVARHANGWLAQCVIDV
jgi:SHS2 domain-containing protein